MASAKLVAPVVAVCALIAVLLVAAPWHVQSAAIASEGGDALSGSEFPSDISRGRVLKSKSSDESTSDTSSSDSSSKKSKKSDSSSSDPTPSPAKKGGKSAEETTPSKSSKKSKTPTDSPAPPTKSGKKGKGSDVPASPPPTTTGKKGKKGGSSDPSPSPPPTTTGKKGKKGGSSDTPATPLPTTPKKKGGHKNWTAPATPTPDPVPAPATNGKKGGKKGANSGAGTGGSAPVVVSKADQKIQGLLKTAAGGVQKAADTLGTKHKYYASLTATVQALTNAGILIDEGQRTLVQGQIANAVSTIDGVSVMLDPVNDKKVLSTLASAKATAEEASKAFKP
ncbi:unnamed protein product [Closterium sp. Naga37s-1]|nr:unnamed protein product [Closterium sp. Naga37s-1]